MGRADHDNMMKAGGMPENRLYTDGLAPLSLSYPAGKAMNYFPFGGIWRAVSRASAPQACLDSAPDAARIPLS